MRCAEIQNEVPAKQSSRLEGMSVAQIVNSREHGDTRASLGLGMAVRDDGER